MESTIWKKFPPARQVSPQSSGIEIRGCREFIEHTEESLTLLCPLPEFALIRDHLGVIRQARRSGMKAWLAKPTFAVGKATWKHSALWYAGAIAHDAYHAKLYCDVERAPTDARPAADGWTGAAAERQCLEFQLRVLRQLGADDDTLRYLESCRENPTYQGRNRGWASWLDYLKRWW
jgi:hypothetical protein